MKNEMIWSEAKLPFPLKASGIAGVEVYEIPEEKKEKVLRDMYPFEGLPALDDFRTDLHNGKSFQVRQFLVVRERGMNLLVGPFYFEGGGTVIDWGE